MIAGFMLETMADIVLPSTLKFFSVTFALACLSLFQSMLTKIMFAAAVLCSSGLVPSTVAEDDGNGDHGDDIALLVE